ncbi:MAG: DUF3048 domain-containing protein [Anaerolineaceae bacterium]
MQSTRIAAGFTPTSPPTNTPFPIITSTPTPESNPSLFENADPLTGKKLPDGTELTRPLLVKLANWPETLRPSVGLNQADMVFEYSIGHQMNHLVALYLSSDAEIVAPMAPARPFDMTLTDLYQANLAIAGAEPAGEETLLTRFPNRVALQNFVPCPAVCADFGRTDERTVANTEALKQYFESKQTDLFIPDLAVNTFALQPPSSSELAKAVSVEYADFSVMQWRYNQTTSLYELWQDHQKANGKYELVPATDEADGSMIAFENIVVIYSKYIEYKLNSYDITLLPGARPGQALFFRDGRVTFGRWQITEPNTPLQFRKLDDSLYGLKPGATWVVFVTENSKSDQTAPGEWQIAFSIK